MVNNLKIYGVDNLQQVIAFLNGESELEVTDVDTRAEFAKAQQYNDVVLRFITSYYEGGECLKILPTVKNDAADKGKAIMHLGIVLGRFAELLNNHFDKIGTYETMLL